MKKNGFPNSCGLRVMIIDGGEGFKEIQCCSHSVTSSAMQDLSFGELRSSPDLLLLRKKVMPNAKGH